MYVPQGIKKPGPGRRVLSRLAEACRAGAVPRAPEPEGEAGQRGGQPAAELEAEETDPRRSPAASSLSLPVRHSVGSAFLLLARSDVFAVTVLTVQGNRMATEQQILG